MSVLDLRDSVTGEYIYKSNQYKIYKYTDDYYRLIKFKGFLRTSGYELDIDKNKSPKGSSNDEKLSNNIRRAKAKITELALCNDFNYFCTFTIDGKKYPRNDLKGFYSKFSRWLRYQQLKRGKMNYLLAPELHADGENWHMHGLINIVDDSMLTKFIAGIHPQKLVDSDYLNWEECSSKFGFCTFDKVRDKKRISFYIKKYITKNITDGYNHIKLNHKLYYCSQGLRGKEEIKNGTISDNIATVLPDFENDYVIIKELNKSQLQSLEIL